MKRPRGRPPSAAPKTANCYTVNYDDTDNDIVARAAKLDGDVYTGRWIARAALMHAMMVVNKVQWSKRRR